MNCVHHVPRLILCSVVTGILSMASIGTEARAEAPPLGNAFTYQGLLNSGGSPYNGTADFQFLLFDGSGGGATQIGGTIPINGITVTNGVFTVNLNFGSVFQGDERWLEIRVATPSAGGAGPFSTLGPRQLLTPSPYALFALNVNGATITNLNADNLATGTVPSARVSGTYSGAVNFNNAANSFTGNGAGLTNLSAANISTGTLPIARGGTGATTAAAALTNLNAQQRVTGTAPVGSYIRVINADGTVVTGVDQNSGGTVTTINTGAGLTGGPITGTGTVSVANNGITNLMLASDAASLNKVSGGAMATNGTSVGIGTTTPIGWLHGVFSASTYLRAEKTTSGPFGMRFNSPDLDWWLLLDNGLGPDNSFSVYNSVNRLTIMPSGQVGIGTGNSVPSAMLDIRGDNTLRVGNGAGEISLNGNNGTLTGNGSDGLINWRLWNGAWGELNLWDGAVANNLNVTLRASDSLLLLNNPNNNARMELQGNIGGETRMTLFNDLGNSTVFIDTDGANAGRVLLRNSSGTNRVELTVEDAGTSAEGGQLILRNASGVATIEIDASFNGDGRIITQELQITGGSDLSEQFDINSAVVDLEPQPGMVVSIDPDNPGKLLIAARAYDRCVAGIISGAGGVKPGMLMGQKGTEADGKLPVALTGRVYVRVTDINGSIEPGDLLTTSDVPGCAMKVMDFAKAQGAIIGKAMTRANPETGLVLVLVSLQ